MIKYFVPMYKNQIAVEDWADKWLLKSLRKKVRVIESSVWKNEKWWGILYSNRSDISSGQLEFAVEIHFIEDSEITYSPGPRKIWLKEIY